MFGLTEYHIVNQCTICEETDPEESGDKLAISLQKILKALLYQQALGNDKVLNYKIQCLKMMKTLLLDMFESQDHLHQVQIHHEKADDKIDLDYILHLLLNHLELNHNFDCSKEILEILNLIIGQ